MNLCENSRVQLSKQHCATLSGKNLERRHVTSLRGRSQVCQTPWWHHPTPDTWRRMVDGPRASAAGDPGRQDSVGRRVVVGGVWKPCLGRLIQQCQPCLSLTGVVLSTLAHLIQVGIDGGLSLGQDATCHNADKGMPCNSGSSWRYRLLETDSRGISSSFVHAKVRPKRLLD